MKNRVLAALFAFLLVFSFSVPALANSPVPPDLAVYVEDAPEDLEMALTFNGKEEQCDLKLKENVYCFYFSNALREENVVLRVSAGGKEYSLDVDAKMFRNGADLSFASGEPVLTARPATTLAGVLLNVGVTLVIEFIILLIFGYRKGRTFLIFLIANLITQGLYNAYLCFPISDKTLLIAEAVIILIEGCIYCFTFREHTKERAWIYAVTANIASAVIGTIVMLLI